MAARARRSAGAGGPQAPRTLGWLLARLALIGAIVVAVLFAVQGGEYGTADLFRLNARLAREQAAVDSLEKRVAELDSLKRAIERDPATQERIAREEFGMVKKGEALYRFTEPDSL